LSPFEEKKDAAPIFSVTSVCPTLNQGGGRREREPGNTESKKDPTHPPEERAAAIQSGGPENRKGPRQGKRRRSYLICDFCGCPARRNPERRRLSRRRRLKASNRRSSGPPRSRKPACLLTGPLNGRERGHLARRRRLARPATPPAGPAAGPGFRLRDLQRFHLTPGCRSVKPWWCL
jgi:hypothetical protein